MRKKRPNLFTILFLTTLITNNAWSLSCAPADFNKTYEQSDLVALTKVVKDKNNQLGIVHIYKGDRKKNITVNRTYWQKGDWAPFLKKDQLYLVFAKFNKDGSTIKKGLCSPDPILVPSKDKSDRIIEFKSFWPKD